MDYGSGQPLRSYGVLWYTSLITVEASGMKTQIKDLSPTSEKGHEVLEPILDWLNTPSAPPALHRELLALAAPLLHVHIDGLDFGVCK